MNFTLTIKPLDNPKYGWPREYDLFAKFTRGHRRGEKLDAHVRFEQLNPASFRWTLDIFDASVKNADRAHLDSICVRGTLEQPDWATVFAELEIA